MKEDNSNLPQILDHPYRILIVGRKDPEDLEKQMHYLIWQFINQVLIKFIYMLKLYMKQNELLVNKRESTVIKHFNDSKAFIEYSNDMNDIYNNIEENNPNKRRKILVVVHKILNPIVTELFIRGRKLNTSLVFIMQSYFAVPKNIKSNSTNYFVMKILNERELQQIAINRSSHIDFQDSMHLYKKILQNHIRF